MIDRFFINGSIYKLEGGSRDHVDWHCKCTTGAVFYIGVSGVYIPSGERWARHISASPLYPIRKMVPRTMWDQQDAIDRRRTLELLGTGGFATIAGCFGGDPQPDETNGGDENGSDNDSNNGSDSEDGDGGDAPPGGDQLGGPNDLRSDVTVEALALDSDQGAGQFVFSPAVVWLEPGATITFENTSGSHSATAYHPNNDQPLRIPTGAASFDSGVMEEGESFEQTFDEPGVYNYYCTPHEGLGMVGLVIVREATPGPGTEPVEDVESADATENIERLLEQAVDFHTYGE